MVENRGFPDLLIDKASQGPYLLQERNHLEDYMLELTANAQKELDAYFADKEKAPIRIYLAPGG